MKRTPLTQRKLPDYTHSEEVFNMTTHIVGGAIGVVATVLCVIMAAWNHNVWGVVSGSIFGATMIVLYAISSIYHGLSHRLYAKKVLQVIDHCSIFILIAGTYTPYTLVTLRSVNPAMGWVIFGIVWGFAALGIVLNSIDLKKYKLFSMICYLGMGWCILMYIKPTVTALGFGGSMLLLSGGVAYTIGAVLYGIGHHKKWFHSIFHIFVCIGSLLHFFSILFYVM